MLICRSNNFVFIRNPKASSTSALFYFLNSGLYDKSKDTVEVETPFSSWVEMEKHFKRHSKDYIEKAFLLFKNSHSQNSVNVHSSYEELVGKGLIKDNMPCYSVIRNPVDRLCSIYCYEQKRSQALRVEKIDEALNEFCYSACIKGEKIDPEYSKKLQSSYFPDHAKLWNTENLHEYAVADITALGGKVDNRIHVRKTSQEPKDYKSLLSHEVVQMIELKYAQDFVLWEKAYAVYN